MTSVRLSVGLVLAAVLPAVFAVVFLVSAVLRRSVLGPVLSQTETEIARELTLVWGVVLLAIAGLQGAGTLIGFGSITSPSGLAIRFVFALLVEIAVLGGTIVYLRRSVGADPQM